MRINGRMNELTIPYELLNEAKQPLKIDTNIIPPRTFQIIFRIRRGKMFNTQGYIFTLIILNQNTGTHTHKTVPSSSSMHGKRIKQGE